MFIRPWPFGPELRKFQLRMTRRAYSIYNKGYSLNTLTLDYYSLCKQDLKVIKASELYSRVAQVSRSQAKVSHNL